MHFSSQNTHCRTICKNHFSYFQKDIPKVHTFFISKVLEVYFDLCLFFSWIDINFAFQKALLLVRPWPFLQPPEAKLLILKGQKYSYLCKFSYELQFAGLGWGLILNWKFWNGKIFQWHWIFQKTSGDQQGVRNPQIKTPNAGSLQNSHKKKEYNWQQCVITLN